MISGFTTRVAPVVVLIDRVRQAYSGQDRGLQAAEAMREALRALQS